MIDLLSHPLVKSIAEYAVKVHISGLYFVNNADCGLRPGVSGASLRFVGACVSSALMLENGAYFDAENPMMNHEGIVNPYFKYLALCMPIPKEKAKISAPLAVYFRDLKIALLRESEDDQVGLCMALKGGTNGESHNHNDIGQLYLYKDGNPIVVDLGGMEYTKKTFSSERYTIMAMRSLYHSTVTPRGYEQLSGAQFASSDEHFDAEARTVSMQLKNSYPAEAGIEDLTRCATLCDGMLTVTDYVAFAEEGDADYRKHWQTAPATLPEHEYSGMKCVGELLQQLPAGSVLHLGNSSAVRYAQLFPLPEGVQVECNRGVNGIEGSVSTAAGHALANPDRLHFLIIGDLSIFYDLNGLLMAQQCPNLRILLLNNQEGGIFGTLPGMPDCAAIRATHGESIMGWCGCNLRCKQIFNNGSLWAEALEMLRSSAPKPVLVEVFTKTETDAAILKEFYNKH